MAEFLDGEEGRNEETNLGEGLDYKGESGNYPDMKIHIKDLEEFVNRVKRYLEE